MVVWHSLIIKQFECQDIRHLYCRVPLAQGTQKWEWPGGWPDIEPHIAVDVCKKLWKTTALFGSLLEKNSKL